MVSAKDIGEKLIFRTEGGDPNTLRGRWAEIMSSCYYQLEISRFSKIASFSGSVSLRTVGGISISRMQSDSHQLARSKATIAHDSRNSLLFVVATKGHFSFEHLGRDGLVRAGEALVINTAEPYKAICSDAYENICFEVGIPKIAHRVTSVEDTCGRTMHLDGSSLWFFKQTLGSMLDIGESDDGDSNGVNDEISRFILDLAANNMGRLFRSGQGDENTAYRGKVRRRICTYILDNLTDSKLSPQAIAEANGVSISYLHKLFSSSGTSVNRWIIEKRLDRSMEKLTDPFAQTMSITEIAYAHGFSNSAHFSTRFQKRFGLAPREAREQR
jgi:AraC-like DNA-binding protein